MSISQQLSSVVRLITGYTPVPVEFVREGSGWLTKNLPKPSFSPPKPVDADRIEARARETEKLGAKPLWSGYAEIPGHPQPGAGSTRKSDDVRSSALAGRLYAWLASERSAKLIIEFGTAFGVSGMYWLAGLKRTPAGRLLTFEPNVVWAEIARTNLASIGQHFELVVGTFEESIGTAMSSDQRIDIAFVDAIHTSEFVFRQFEILLPRMRPGGLVLFDDIDFSDNMAACWRALANDNRVAASATFSKRLGIVELNAALS